MTDRLREEIRTVNDQLHDITLVRRTLTEREDRLLRRRQMLFSQLSDERDESDGDGDSP